jgi:hypothetical protein
LKSASIQTIFDHQRAERLVVALALRLVAPGNVHGVLTPDQQARAEHQPVVELPALAELLVFSQPFAIGVAHPGMQSFGIYEKSPSVTHINGNMWFTSYKNQETRLYTFYTSAYMRQGGARSTTMPNKLTLKPRKPMTLKPGKPLTLKIPVNRRALIARVERALAKQGRELHADRMSNQTNFYVVDTEKQVVVETGVDIETLARQIGALKPWEVLARGNWRAATAPLTPG